MTNYKESLSTVCTAYQLETAAMTLLQNLPIMEKTKEKEATALELKAFQIEPETQKDPEKQPLLLSIE